MNRNDTVQFLQDEFAVGRLTAQQIAAWLEKRDTEREDVAKAVAIKHGVASSPTPEPRIYHLTSGTREWRIAAPNIDVATVASLSYIRGATMVTCLDEDVEPSQFSTPNKTSTLIQFVVENEKKIRAAYKTVVEEEN